jgi:hypothetical protein
MITASKAQGARDTPAASERPSAIGCRLPEKIRYPKADSRQPIAKASDKLGCFIRLYSAKDFYRRTIAIHSRKRDIMAQDNSGESITINVVEMGVGWIYFELGEVKPAANQLAYTLNRAMYDWLQDNPGVTVRETLGIVAEGATVGIHIWYDGLPISQ